MDHLYRRNQIRELLQSETVATQEELRRRLARRGIHVTQATISRDIQDLGLIKTREGYHLPDTAEPLPAPLQPSLPVVLKEFVRETLAASNLVVVKTNPGNAHSVGVALDAERWPEVVGTVAGDDTIFIATPGPSEARRVRKKILSILAD